ncbi:MAG: hypothetical protein OQK03_04540, partial [Colwellia sp.]|nr:hypothetical protein [Colwellia sp.]
INLLKAQESILSLELQLIDSRRSLLFNRVLLYRELSHGNFDKSQFKTAKQMIPSRCTVDCRQATKPNQLLPTIAKELANNTQLKNRAHG